MMAGSLHLIAATGTDNLTEPIGTQDRTLEYLLDALDNDNVAARLLRGAGLLTLREKAGYIPSQDPRPLEKAIATDKEHKQDAYSHEVVRFLSAIYWGQYPETYPEWLHWVALEELAFPYEALPLMLSLATWFPSTQALTKRVIGSRGRWLVDYSGHRGWYWAKHIKPARRPRLTKYEKYEARIIERLAMFQYRRLPLEVSYELRLMTFPWSERFSELLARTIESMLDRRDKMTFDDLARLADTVKWHIHPGQRETVVAAFRNYNQLEETQAIARNLTTLMQFRAEMLASFTKNGGLSNHKEND